MLGPEGKKSRRDFFSRVFGVRHSRHASWPKMCSRSSRATLASLLAMSGDSENHQRPTARLSSCPKTNLRSRAHQEADVKPRFLTGAAPNLTAPNLALLFADDATTAESILARKRGIENHFPRHQSRATSAHSPQSHGYLSITNLDIFARRTPQTNPVTHPHRNSTLIQVLIEFNKKNYSSTVPCSLNERVESLFRRVAF